MNPTRVEVTIDELVLHGFAPGDRFAIAEALQGELTRLLVEQGVPPAFTQGGDVARLQDSGSFARTPTGVGVGAQAAQAVYGGFLP